MQCSVVRVKTIIIFGYINTHNIMEDVYTISDDVQSRFASILNECGFHKWSKPYIAYGYRYAFAADYSFGIIGFFNFPPNGITKNIHYLNVGKHKCRIKIEGNCTLDEINNMNSFEQIMDCLMDLERSFDLTKLPAIDWKAIKDTVLDNRDYDIVVYKEKIDAEFDAEDMLKKYNW